MEETLEIKRPKLLLADDSITIRKVVELTFAEEGVDVFAVGDGDAAMQKFVEIEPDIVLVDVNMPEPDGYHICEMIKQDDSTKDIPVLLLVGSFEPFDTAEAERVGADGFLIKPFQSVRELVGKVTELLGDEDAFAPPPPAETADIESLYTSSVSETYRGPDSTTDAFLGDAGMDDDLIDASYLSDGPEPERPAESADASLAETFQGYDWMAQPVDEPESEPANGGLEQEPARETAIEMYESEPQPEPEAEPQPEPGPQPERETAFDMYEPELELESEQPNRRPEEARFESSNSFEIVANEFESTLDVADPQPEAPEESGTAIEEPQLESFRSFERVADEFEDTLDVEEPQPEEPDSGATPEESQFEYSNSLDRVADEFEATVDVEGPQPEAAENGATSDEAQLQNPVLFDRVADEFEDTLDVEEPQSEPADNGAPTAESFTPYVPSEEFIEIIARRVLEHLSDKAVRDIARETVPRITEKLIREALDQESKKHNS